MLDRAFDALEPEALTRGVAFERGIEPLPTVVTDEGRLQRIVGNLLDNAIHWTPAGRHGAPGGHAPARTAASRSR